MLWEAGKASLTELNTTLNIDDVDLACEALEAINTAREIARKNNEGS